MSRFWNERIKNLEAYVPGEQPQDRQYIKLNTNENPYPPSPRVIEAIREAADGSLKLYPDPECEKLRETLAEYYHLRKEEVFVGNGSDEVLAFSFAAFFCPEQPVLFPDITYSFYPVYSNFFNLKYDQIPLNEDFSVPVEKFFKPNGGVIIPNPNAPTSRYLSVPEIIKILDFNLSINRVVVVDEAYIDFGGESIVGVLERYPNLLVVHTLSKSRSLAGLRVGFALGHKELIEGLNRVKSSINSYTVDRLALAGAVEALKDEEYFQLTRNKIIKTRNEVAAELIAAGFKVVESQANFIFISHPLMHASELYKKLKENGILVRYFKKPRIDNFIRVSIGTDEEMKKFLQTIIQILEQEN